jgi:hypothetical protein
MKTRKHRLRSRKNKCGGVKQARKQARKRARNEIDMDFNTPFQHLINAIGDEEILTDFADFNGRPDCQVLRGKSRSGIVVPPEFCGIAYDGGHWKGYEALVPGTPRVIYDSYVSGLQIPATNNFCQSYATYIWAKKGNKAPFISGKFTENAKKMSTIWIDYFNSFLKGKNADMKIWLDKAIKEGSKLSVQEGHGAFDIKEVMTTLQKLSTDDASAGEFSTSS